MKRIFYFLLSLLIALYLLVYVAQTVYPVSFLPTLSALPGFAESHPESETSEYAAQVLGQVVAVDSLVDVIAGMPVEGGDAVAQQPVVDSAVPPPVPTGEHVRHFEYEELGRDQLARFFSALPRARKEQIRILHFGDSQIEGDRVSSYLRRRLQKTYSGAGVGMVSLIPSAYLPYGLQITPSYGWKLLSIMPPSKRQTEVPYGILGSTAICHAAVAHDDTVTYTGQVEVQRRRSAGRSMGFSHCRVMYHATASQLALSLAISDSVSDLAFSPSDSALYAETLFPLPGSGSRFSIQCHSPKPIEIYALSFESATGIQVDNIPIRGSSGSDLGAISSEMLSACAAHLKPRLVLLQFGVNVVPGQQASYDYYRRRLKRQILRIQKYMPSAALILMGVSDMGVKEGESFHSYPNIPKVKEAQRQAAFETGIAFWDTEAAMGGENSIIAWVHAPKPLATHDYVHFTPRGARLIGELFYAALMAEYRDYSNGYADAQ